MGARALKPWERYQQAQPAASTTGGKPWERYAGQSPAADDRFAGVTGGSSATSQSGVKLGDSLLDAWNDEFASGAGSLAEQNREFVRKSSFGGRLIDNIRRGWLGARASMSANMLMPLVERGAGAVEDGDVLLGTDPLGMPIYASQVYTRKQLPAVAESHRAIGDAAAAGLAQSVAPIQARMAAIPQRPATEALLQAKSFKEGLGALAIDPIGVIGDIGVPSMVQMAPGLVASAAVRRPLFSAGAMGATSATTELGSGVLDYLADQGVNISDQDELKAALRDRGMVQGALNEARIRAGIIGSVDGASGGLAGRSLVPKKLVNSGAGREAINVLAAQPAAQAAMGAGGEAAAQYATRGEIQPGDVLAEAIGEFFMAPAEVGPYAAQRTMDAVRSRGERGRGRSGAESEPAKPKQRETDDTPRHGRVTTDPETGLPAVDLVPEPPVSEKPAAQKAKGNGLGDSLAPEPTEDIDRMLLRNIPPADGGADGGAGQKGEAAAGLGDHVAGPASEGDPKKESGSSRATMQNRDRSRAASVAQMQNIRKSPDAARLGFSRDSNTGALMVSRGQEIPSSDLGRTDVVVQPDGRRVPVQYAVVEADQVQASHDADGRVNPAYEGAQLQALNNGRMAGLQAAWQSGNAENYIAGLSDDAALHGVSAEAIASKRQPVLVRLYDPAENLTGAESNASQQLGLSPTEQAQTDASNLPSLEGLAWNEDGSLSPTANADFFRGWFRKMGDTAAANLQDAQGRPNAAAIQRVRAALVYRSYGDERILTALAEDIDPDNRNVLNAMARAAPAYASLDESHPLTAELRQTVTSAMHLMADAKARGMTIEDFVAQGDILGRDPNVERIASYYATNARSAKRIAEMLANAAEVAREDQAHAQTVDIFGDSPTPTVQSVLDRAGVSNDQEVSDARAVREDAPDRNRGGEQAGRGRAAAGDSAQAGREGLGFQLAQQPAAGSGSEQARPALAPAPGGLFGAPTTKDHVDAARRQKDAQRDGRTGTGRTDMQAGEGELFAGRRPEQGDIETGQLPAHDVSSYGDTRPLLPAKERGSVRSPQGAVEAGRRSAPVLLGQLDLFVATRGQQQPGQGHPPAVRIDRSRLAQSARLVETGQFRSGIDRVQTLEHAAHILAPLRKSAQERFMVLALDADGRPLAVMQHTVGGLAESAVYTGTVLGATASIPGVRSVVFAHNHPSGNPRPSESDLRLDGYLLDAFNGSGIDVRGSIILLPGDRSFTVYGMDGKTVAAPNGATLGRVTPARRSGSVPVVERALRKVRRAGAAKAVSDFHSAVQITKEFRKQNPAGIVLLDNQLNLIGMLPFDPSSVEKLRTDNLETSHAAWISAATEANASSVILYGDASQDRGLSNMARAMKLGEFRVLDSILYSGDAAESQASRGRDLSRGLMESVSEDGGTDNTLVVTHNLSAENVMHALRMGGLAVPSLSVSDYNQSITGFGDITLIGDASLADPKHGAKAFGADIYSPRYPSINYRLDRSALASLNKILAPFADGREIYGGQIDSVRDLTDHDAFRAYRDNALGENWTARQSDALAEKLLDDVGAQQRIFQGYTQSGNRRYSPHTLENVVRILKKELRGGEGFNYGTGSLRAKFTPQFRSITAIRKAKGRLQKKEAFEAARQEVEDELFAIADDLRPYYKHEVRTFDFTDTVIGLIGDAARIGVERASQKYGFEDVPSSVAERISQYMQKLRDMPTEYFEVKHLRSVGIDEFRAAVVPHDIDPSVKQALEDAGLSVSTYNDKSDAGRRKAVAAAATNEGLRFLEVPGGVEEDASNLSDSDRDLYERWQRDTADRHARDRQMEAAAERSQLEGEADADRLGLRDAVNAVVGRAKIKGHFLRNIYGLHGLVDRAALDGLERRIEARARQGSRGEMHGLYVPARLSMDGKPFYAVFTDAANTPELAALTAAHEVSGHFGLKRLFGKDLDSALRIAGQNTTVRKVAEAIAKQRRMSDGDRSKAIEEALAELSAAIRNNDFDMIRRRYGVDVPAGMQRNTLRTAIANFIKRLKALFAKRGVELTDEQVRALLEAAHMAAEGENITASIAGGDGVMTQIVFDGANEHVIGEPEAVMESFNDDGDMAAQIRSEREATSRAYGGREGYERAKATGRTKLTYHQWVEVRTPRFKKWFGDWEALGHRSFLDGRHVAELSGNEFSPDGVPLTEKVPKWYADQGASTVDVDGIGPVSLDKVAVKNSLSHGIGRAKAAAFAAVPRVLRDGRIIHQEGLRGSRSSGRVFHVAAPIRMGGSDFVVDVLVKSDAQTSRMYVHEVVLKEKLQKSAFKTGADAAEAGVRTGTDSGAIRSVLQSIYSVNPETVSKVTDPETGEPLVVYHGSATDFSAFDVNRLGSNTGYGDAVIGFHFADNRADADFYATMAAEKTGEAGVVRAFYLSMQNPLVVGIDETDGNAGEQTQDFLDDKNLAEEYAVTNGHDGIIYLYGTNVDSGYTAIAFHPEQIKSATANSGNYSTDADSLFESFVPTPEQESFMAKAGVGRDTRSTMRKIQDWVGERVPGMDAAKDWIKNDARVGALDMYYGLRRAADEVGGIVTELDPYIATRQINIASTMEAILRFGAPKMVDGALRVDRNIPGLLDALTPVKDALPQFFGWMVARRAQLLKSQGRENLMTDADIQAGLSLREGNEAAFDQAARDYLRMKNAILDFAEKHGGTIDPVARALWDHAEYLPFYREGDVGGVGTRAGIANQTAGIRRLKGGEQALRDPLANIIQNFTRLMDSALKNRASTLAVDQLGARYFKKMPMDTARAMIPLTEVKKHLLAEGVSEQVIDSLPRSALTGMGKMLAIEAPTGDDVVRIMRNGKAEYYQVLDPLVMRAMVAMADRPSNAFLDFMSFFKNVLTAGATSTPDFAIRNTLRDTGEASITARENFIPLVDTLRGAYESATESELTQDLMMAGSYFRGGLFRQGDANATARATRRALRKHGLSELFSKKVAGTLINPKTILGLPKAAWDLYRGVLESTEMGSRVSLARNRLDAGGSFLEAAHEAKDFLDFQLRGDWAMTQWAIAMIPFLNARLQGNYRLARAATAVDRRKAVALRMATLASFSAALYAWNMLAHGDDYDELEDWDKDAYWHIAPGTKYHMRIAKPFELGLIAGTGVERMTAAFMYQAKDGKYGDRPGQTWDAFVRGMGDTLAMNPIPQGLKPLVETYFNYNTFTGRKIESDFDKFKAPSERAAPWSSETAQAVSKGMEATLGDERALSARQLEHLWRGYTGGLGMYLLNSVDWVTRKLQDSPERPEKALAEMPGIGAIYRGDMAPRSTRHVGEFYDLRDEARRRVDQIRTAVENGEDGRAKNLERTYGWLVGERVRSKQARAGIAYTGARELDRVGRGLSALRKQEREIYSDRTMTASEKRERLDAIKRERAEITRKAVISARNRERQRN